MRYHDKYATTKKRIGYEITTNDDLVFNILYVYANAKSVLWNIFFGWRKVDNNGNYILRITGRKNFLMLKYIIEDTLNELNK